MLVFYSDHHTVQLPEGHRFPMPKYGLVRKALLEEGVLATGDLQPALPATREQILLAHNPAYYDAVADGSLERRIVRQIGLPWSPQLVERTLASVGGSICAAKEAIRNGISGNLAGGTHHALAGEGGGFCVFNDLAVTALVMLAEGAARRVAVIDLDVHQGNGTAAILAGRPEVFTLSLHGQRNYPFRKVASTLDIGLEDGAGDEAYLEALEDGLRAAFAFNPDLVLYQAGVDVLAEDRLGRLTLSMEGLAERDRRVLAECCWRGIPTALVLGGGYAEPIELTVQAHVQTYRVARSLYG